MLRFASLELPSFLGVEQYSSETPFPYLESSEDPSTFDTSSQPSTLYSEELPFFLDGSSPQGSPKKREGKVTTIQEYTQLVMNCMKCGQDMTTTEVARKIMDKVKPKPFSLTVNIRRRVGDALSVLNAIHKVSKTKRGYVWNDNQSSSDSNPNHHSTCHPSTEEKLMLEALHQKLKQKQKILRLLQERAEQLQIMEQKGELTGREEVPSLQQRVNDMEESSTDVIPSESSQTDHLFESLSYTSTTASEDSDLENRECTPDIFFHPDQHSDVLFRTPSFHVDDKINWDNRQSFISTVSDFADFAIPSLSPSSSLVLI